MYAVHVEEREGFAVREHPVKNAKLWSCMELAHIWIHHWDTSDVLFCLRFIGHGSLLQIKQDIPECAKLLTVQLRWCWRQICLQPFCDQHSAEVREEMMFWAGRTLHIIFIFSCPQLTALSYTAKAPWGRALWSTLRRPLYGQRMTKNPSAVDLCCLLSVYWGSLFPATYVWQGMTWHGTQDGHTENEKSDHWSLPCCQDLTRGLLRRRGK